MAADRQWGQVVLVGPHGGTGRYVLSGPGHPTIDTVGLLARLALVAKRLGGRLAVEEACPELRELLEFAGLGVEVQRETEGGKEPLVVDDRQEEVHRHDLAP
jgi:hypothetical protein